MLSVFLVSSKAPESRSRMKYELHIRTYEVLLPIEHV